MARISNADRAPSAQPKPTEPRGEAAALPTSLAELAKTKLIDVHLAVAGDTLFTVWKAKASAMAWPEFEKLNAQLNTAEREGGNTLVVGDAIAIPSQAQARATDKRVADSYGAIPLPHLVPPAEPSAEFLELLKNSRPPGKEPFTFAALGKKLIADADKNIARLAKEQDDLGASTTGVTRQVLGAAAAAGAFMGKTVHSLERLAGLAIEGIAIAGDKPEETFHKALEAARGVSVGGTVNAVVHVAQGLAGAAVEAADKRGLASAVVETALNVVVSRGAGALSKEKIVTDLANAAEKASGGDAVVAQVAEAAKRSVKNQTLVQRMGAIAASIEPVADAAVSPAVNATRAAAAATVINKAPASSTDGKPE